MVWLLCPLLIVASILGYLLFAPFYLEINSANGLCAIRFHRLASAKLVFRDRSIKIELKIAGWKKQIDPINQFFKRIASETARRPSKQSKSKRLSFNLLKAILNSFKVNKCYLNIDTGSMELNGILYPGFYCLSYYTGKPIRVNFQDKNEIAVEIENNCARVIRAFIYSSLKTKNHGKLR